MVPIARRSRTLNEGTTSRPRPCSICEMPVTSPIVERSVLRLREIQAMPSFLRSMLRTKFMRQLVAAGSNDSVLNGIAISSTQPSGVTRAAACQIPSQSNCRCVTPSKMPS